MSEGKTVEWLWDIVCKLDEMVNKRIDKLEGYNENFREDISVKFVELEKKIARLREK